MVGATRPDKLMTRATSMAVVGDNDQALIYMCTGIINNHCDQVTSNWQISHSSNDEFSVDNTMNTQKWNITFIILTSFGSPWYYRCFSVFVWLPAMGSQGRQSERRQHCGLSWGIDWLFFQKFKCSHQNGKADRLIGMMICRWFQPTRLQDKIVKWIDSKNILFDFRVTWEDIAFMPK